MKKESIWCNAYRYWAWGMYGIVCLSSIGCDPMYSDQPIDKDPLNLGFFGMLCEGPLNPRSELRQKDLQALENTKEEELKKIVKLPQAVALSPAQCTTLKQQLKWRIEIMYDLIDLEKLVDSPFKELVKPSACSQDQLDTLLSAVVQRFKERVSKILSHLKEANKALADFEAIIDKKHGEKKHDEKSTEEAYIDPLIADIEQLLSSLGSSISTYQLMKVERFLFDSRCSCLSFVMNKIAPPMTMLYPIYRNPKHHPIV